MKSENTFWVRDVPVSGDVILAPMAGYSDVPHRALCRSFGSAMSYTEFIAAEDILSGSKHAQTVLDFRPDDRPMVFQMFGNNAKLILRAAQQLEALGPDIIDVNMGCSSRRVSGRGAGVGMMPQPRLVAETLRLLSSNLSVPVTGKIRLGWERHRNYLEIAHVMEDSGASLIAIHPRTKEQRYSGMADWDAIAQLKQEVSVPIIGNGDVRKPADIDRMLEYTGCDGVMIGRGAIGNPWIFGRTNKDQLTLGDLVQVMRTHLREMLTYYGPRGLLLFRKYIKRYFEGMPAVGPIAKKLVVADSEQGVEELLLEAELAYSDSPVCSLRRAPQESPG